jgi:hypothetical protein
MKSTEKSNDLIGNLTRDLSACGIVPQPTTKDRHTLTTPLKCGIKFKPGFKNIYIHLKYTHFVHGKIT